MKKRAVRARVAQCLDHLGEFCFVRTREIVPRRCSWLAFRDQVLKQGELGFVLPAATADTLVERLVFSMQRGGATEIFGRRPEAVIVLDDEDGGMHPWVISKEDDERDDGGCIVWESRKFPHAALMGEHDPTLRYMLVRQLGTRKSW